MLIQLSQDQWEQKHKTIHQGCVEEATKKGQILPFPITTEEMLLHFLEAQG